MQDRGSRREWQAAPGRVRCTNTAGGVHGGFYIAPISPTRSNLPPTGPPEIRNIKTITYRPTEKQHVLAAENEVT